MTLSPPGEGEGAAFYVSFVFASNQLETHAAQCFEQNVCDVPDLTSNTKTTHAKLWEAAGFATPPNKDYAIGAISNRHKA